MRYKVPKGGQAIRCFPSSLGTELSFRVCRPSPLGAGFGKRWLEQMTGSTPSVCLLPAGRFGTLRHKSSSCVRFCVCPCQSQAGAHGELIAGVDCRNTPASWGPRGPRGDSIFNHSQGLCGNEKIKELYARRKQGATGPPGRKYRK